MPTAALPTPETAERQHVAAERIRRGAVSQAVEVRRNRRQCRGLGPERGVGREWREPAHPPREPGQACDGADHRIGAAPFESVREHHRGSASGAAGKPGHREKGDERVTDAGAAIPVGHQGGGSRERRLGVAQPQRAGDPREPGAEGEAFHALGRVVEHVREAQRRLGVLLHRARDVDQQEKPAMPGLAPAPRQHRRIAAVTHRGTKRAAQIDAVAVARARAAQAAAARQALRRLAREAAQPPGPAARLETPVAKPLRRGRGMPGFARIGRLRRLVDRSPLVVDPHLGLVLVLAGNGDEFTVEPGLEQGIELSGPLARGGERCERGSAYVLDAARAEELHRGKEGDGLLGRRGEAEATKKGWEAREIPGGCGHRRRVAHSAALRPPAPAIVSQSATRVHDRPPGPPAALDPSSPMPAPSLRRSCRGRLRRVFRPMAVARVVETRVFMPSPAPARRRAGRRRSGGLPRP